jgi:hypothetical protein
MKARTTKAAAVMVAAIVVMGAAACSFPANTAPSDYVKQVTAYKEGSDGVFVYFILADDRGQMTSSTVLPLSQFSKALGVVARFHFSRGK